jgi:transcription termination/antitermination protein NusG
MDDQNTNTPSDSNTSDADAANSQLIQDQAAQATGETSANPFAALKESDSETREAAGPEDSGAEIAEPEVKEPEEAQASDTIEAIGDNEKTKVEDAESPSADPVTVEESASSEEKSGEVSEESAAADEEPKEDSPVEDPKEKPAVPANPNARWYVVHTFAGHENKVATALRQRIEAERLENLIYDILVPTQDKIEIKGGKKETVKEKIFPGYILIKMELSDLGLQSAQLRA